MKLARCFWGLLFAVLAVAAVFALVTEKNSLARVELPTPLQRSRPIESGSTAAPTFSSTTIQPISTLPPTWTATIYPSPTTTATATPKPTVSPHSDDDLTNALVIPTQTGTITPVPTAPPLPAVVQTPPAVQSPPTAQPPPVVSTSAEYLIIPAINVTARVVHVGLDASGNMEAPAGWYDVAWYRYGPKPGYPGSAALAGHLDTDTGAPATFWDLDQLVPGQQIIFQTASGSQIVFIVEEIATYPWDQVPLDRIFARSGEPRLALITCGGTWSRLHRNYSHRTIVFARLG